MNECRSKFNENSTKNILSFIMYFIKKRKKMFIAYQICSMGTAVDLIVWPLFISHITQILYDVEKVKETAFIVCRNALILYGIMIVLSHLLNRAKAYIAASFILPKLEHDIGGEMLEYVFNKSRIFFDKNDSSDIVSRIENLSINCVSMVTSFVAVIMPNLVAVFWIAFSLFIFHWTLGVCMIASVILHLLVLFYYIKKIIGIMTANSNAHGTLVAKVSDSIINIDAVKFFSNKTIEMKLTKIFLKRYLGTYTKSLMFTERMNWSFTTIHLFFTGFVFIYLLIKLFSTGLINVDNIDYALYAVITSLLYSIWTFSESLPKLFLEAGSCNESLQILCKPNENEKHDGRHIEFDSCFIEFRNIKYRNSESEVIINGLNIRVKDKESVAIIGMSNEEQMAFIDLLIGSANDYFGTITISNTNIQDISYESIRKQITVIPKNITLFNRSVLDNIKYGNNEATFEQVKEVANIAKVHNFILNLDNGYHTLVGDYGEHISYEYKLQILIARALLKNAPIILIEESSVVLKKAKDTMIQKAMISLIEGKTSIIMARRLWSIKQADKIFVFDRKKMIEQGTYIELRSNQKSYYNKVWENNRKSSSDILFFNTAN